MKQPNMLSTVILIITATATALIAGLFYAWSCSVVPGLARLNDAEYLASFQAMNRAILNPVFFASFMGTLVLLPLSAYLHYAPGSMRFMLLVAASVLYAVGVFGVTMAGNVPLNDMLDGYQLQGATAEQLQLMRQKFEKPWNSLNLVRTYAVVITIVLVIIACMNGPKTGNS